MFPMKQALESRGLTGGLIVTWASLWAISVLLTRVAIPPVDPNITSSSRALEQLGTLGLTLPIALTSVLASSRAPWLLVSSTRSKIASQQAPTWIIVGCNCAAAAVLSPLLPRGVSFSRTALLVILFSTLTLLIAQKLGSAWGATPAPALAVVASVRGALPWQANFIYNTEATSLLCAITAVSALCLLALNLRGKA